MKKILKSLLVMAVVFAGMQSVNAQTNEDATMKKARTVVEQVSNNIELEGEKDTYLLRAVHTRESALAYIDNKYDKGSEQYRGELNKANEQFIMYLDEFLGEEIKQVVLKNYKVK
ncbi:MAG: hypothetical protein ACQESK_06825 [Bacteroidota bacterium]